MGYNGDFMGMLFNFVKKRGTAGNRKPEHDQKRHVFRILFSGLVFALTGVKYGFVTSKTSMLSLGSAHVGLAFSMCFAPFGPMLNLYYSYVGLLVEPMWLMLLQCLAYAGPIFGSLEKT